MSRNPTVYTLPPGTTPQVPNTTIQSATWNAAMDDIAQTFNTAQPIEFGGTNATTAVGARTNLDVPSNADLAALVAQMVNKASVLDTRRNRIVNGDKTVSQENLQTAGTNNGRYISDQNAMYFVSSAGTFTGVNSTTLSPLGGFRDRITITTADAALAAGEYLTYTQNIEGSNVRDAKWGAAGAVPIIVRRGFKFPAGTYTVAFHNSGATRSWVGSFTVSGAEANTDIVREFAIPGDVTGTWLNADGVIGLTMDVVIAAGSTFQGVAGWQAGNMLTLAGSTNGMASAGAVFEFFDEGLRLDPDATGVYGAYEVGEVDAKYRPERYLPTIRPLPGSAGRWLGIGQTNSTTSGYLSIGFPVPAAKPATGLAISASTHLSFSTAGGSAVAATGVTLNSGSQLTALLSVVGLSGMVAGDASVVNFNTDGAFMYFTGCRLS